MSIQTAWLLNTAMCYWSLIWFCPFLSFWYGHTPLESSSQLQLFLAKHKLGWWLPLLLFLLSCRCWCHRVSHDLSWWLDQLSVYTLLTRTSRRVGTLWIVGRPDTSVLFDCTGLSERERVVVLCIASVKCCKEHIGSGRKGKWSEAFELWESAHKARS